VAVIAMSFIPQADKQKNIIMFMVFLGIVLIAMGSYRSPAVALMPDLTPKPLRSKANAIINLMGAVGGVYTLVMIMLFVDDDDKNSYVKLFLTVSVIMVIAVILLLITVREKKLAVVVEEENARYTEGEEAVPGAQTDKMPKEVRRSFILILSSIFLWFFAYNAVTTAFSRYAQVVWQRESGGFAGPLLIATIAAIFSYIPIGFISSVIGRKKTIITGIIVLTGTYLCGALFTEYSPWVNVIFAFTGISWAAINVNSYPMVVEMCKGSDIGKYTGVYYFFSMSSQILTPTVSGFLLEYVSYRTLFPYAVVFSLASLCTMLFVKHGDSKPIKKKSALENFDVED
jgi:MFS family permease